MAYRLRLEPEADRATVERVHDFHAERCPVYRSIAAAIDCTTAIELIDV